eukprot:CAMPEP_0168819374 /NCGR_PEP_ID=MMETSP0726-20121227/8262_1 /TAXON_ID=265536 /ORGANISM="Amphiprora sp., Strain CCMP467" /LENGTH=211 /DNA_ID=CAMNT_0008871775 /DNA_START=440 /DNA_END=1074 /DNA_ORIENTATION=+
MEVLGLPNSLCGLFVPNALTVLEDFDSGLQLFDSSFCDQIGRHCEWAAAWGFAFDLSGTTKRVVPGGDVVALRVGDRQATIVHRIVQLSTSGENEQESVGQASRRKYQSVQILTKGDDNRVNDRGLYPPGESWLPVDSILGKVIGIVRFGGMFSILLEEHFWFRAVLLARAFHLVGGGWETVVELLRSGGKLSYSTPQCWPTVAQGPFRRC